MSRTLLAGSMVLTLVLLPGSVDSRTQNATEPTTTKTPPQLVKIVVKDAPDEPVEAQRIFIDPLTKRPRQPTPEELEALRAATTRSPRVMRELHFSGGGVLQEMELGVFDDYVVATLDKDGKVTMRCVRHGITHDEGRPATAVPGRRIAEVK